MKNTIAGFLTRSNDLKRRRDDEGKDEFDANDVLGGWLVGLVILHVFVVTQFEGLSHRGDDVQ